MVKTNRFGVLAVAAGALVAAALLVLVLVVVKPQPAGAAFPGANGRIAFSHFDGDDYEIYTIPANGGTPSQLTDNSTGDDTSPCSSPDGNTIGYTGPTADGRQIFTMPATGGQRHQVTPDAVDNPHACSFTGPRGTHIVYDSPAGGTNSEIFTIPVPASGEPPGSPNQVTFTTFSSGSMSPSFTAEGKRIAYSSRGGLGYAQIYTIPVNGGEPDRVTTSAGSTRRPHVNPDYRPDGQRIVYASRLFARPTGSLTDYEILTISATGGSSSVLTDNGTDDLDPVYSPDGSRIAYSSRDGDGDFEIFTQPATGDWPRHQVTHNSRDDIRPSWLPRVGGTTVPNVVGFSSSDAGRAIRDAGLVPEFTGDPQGGDSWVYTQRPNAGTLVDPGTTVTCRLTNEGDPN